VLWIWIFFHPGFSGQYKAPDPQHSILAFIRHSRQETYVSESESRPIFMMTKFLKMLQITIRNFCINKRYVFSYSYKGRLGSLNMKILLFILFGGKIFACLDPDSQSGSETTTATKAHLSLKKLFRDFLTAF
jgi:hypothetical protein